MIVCFVHNQDIILFCAPGHLACYLPSFVVVDVCVCGGGQPRLNCHHRNLGGVTVPMKYHGMYVVGERGVSPPRHGSHT